MEATRIIRASRLGRTAGTAGTGLEATRIVRASRVGSGAVGAPGSEAKAGAGREARAEAVPSTEGEAGTGLEATRIVRGSRQGSRALASPAGASGEAAGLEATRIVRAARQGRRPEPAEGPASIEESPVASPPPPRLPLALERFALVTWVLGRERAAELLDGLGEHEAERAKEHLRRIAALPSAQRQAKVAVEFGERADAGARLKLLMAEAPEPLRRELFRRLPPY
ncbi:MAG TPA: hypothetical protein VE153_28455, partial [Myxococcus sp.]|nr:hypothetical protein [Myxococcus sp.]